MKLLKKHEELLIFYEREHVDVNVGRYVSPEKIRKNPRHIMLREKSMKIYW